MEALVIDRKTLPESINSFIGAERVRVERAEGRVILSPVIDPADYDNDTDYLSAIPGMVEKIIAGRNTPLSECYDVPEDWFDDDV
jgi:virulence-associated protein VagC